MAMAIMTSRHSATTSVTETIHDEETNHQIEQAFAMIDRDNSGSIEASELNELCRLLGNPMTAAESKQMLKKLDVNGDNEVTQAEFVEWWMATGKKSDIIGGMHMSSLKNIMPNPAMILYHLFEDPQWFKSMGVKGVPFIIAATAISVLMNLFILLSTFAFCFETLDDFSPDPHKNPLHAKEWENKWWAIEVACVSLFTVDLFVRTGAAIAANKTSEFFSDPMNYIDAIAIFPFYIKLVVSGFVDLRFFRVIRLARVLRTIPSPLYQGVGRVVADIVVDSAAPLFVPLFFMMLAMVIMSTLTYYAEAAWSLTCEFPDGTKVKNWNNLRTTQGNEGCMTPKGCECAGTLWAVGLDGEERESATFSSIPDTFWWCIVTFCTVGYGDVNPITPLGKIIAAVTMVIGIFFLAMPLAITGASFVNAWDKLEARARIIEEEDQQRAKGEEVNAEAVEEEDDDSFQNLLQCKANLSSAITSIQALMDQKLENQIVDPSFDYTSILASIQGADASLTDLTKQAEQSFLDRSRLQEAKPTNDAEAEGSSGDLLVQNPLGESDEDDEDVEDVEY